MAEYLKPLPSICPETKPFWEGCKRHELLIQRCNHCGKYQFFPRAFCGNCFSSDVEWRKASGKGEVYTYTVTYQNRAPGFREEVPYVLAYIELEEGVRMMSNVIDCQPEEMKIGMPVEVVFQDVSEEITLPKFKSASK